jgi:hypothetical protein
VTGRYLLGTLRLLVVAIGGWMLTKETAEPWTVFALVAPGLSVFGSAAVLLVRVTRWFDEGL